MSEHDIIDVGPIGTDLEPVQHGSLFRTDDPVEVIRRATEMAGPLADVVRTQKLTSMISGKEHVRVEGWTLLGSMLGVFPVCEWTRPLPDGGWEARVEARTLAGQVIGAAEAQCTRSEKMWASRDDYALRSMAQTRATSKALRQPLGFVMQLAGFDPTPAEEMPRDAHSAPQEHRSAGPNPLAAPKSWAKLTEIVAAYDQTTHDVFFQFADAARRLEFPDVESKDLSKADKAWLFQKTAGAAMRLREAFEPTELPPPGIEDVRAAFAAVLDGQELAIPDEVLDAETVDAAERDA